MNRTCGFTAALAAVAIVGLDVARADTQTWNAATGDWFEAANWASDGTARVPIDGDDVVINAAGAQVHLTNSTAALGSLTLAGAGLVMSNWDTLLSATNVTVANGGVLTCAGPFTNTMMSNRVNLVCTTLVIEAGGAIDVKGKGWSGGYNPSGATGIGNGPGGGAYMCGASYGGVGTQGEYSYRLTNAYGSATAPADPGSGGWGYMSTWGGHGGGAVRVTAHAVTVNGRINADGTSASNSIHAAGGSGGGIYLSCSTLAGTHGLITANAGDPQSGQSGGGSGGGRIAVHYDPAAQAGLIEQPSIGFQAKPSLSGSKKTVGDIGTLYFPDGTLFSPTNLFTGQWVGPGPAALALSDWTVSNVWLRLPGFDVTITNTLTVAGTNPLLHRLEFTNGAAFACSNLLINSASFGAGGLGNTGEPPVACRATVNGPDGPTLTCAGNLIVTNTGRLYVYAGLTNSGAEPGIGARVFVGNEFRIAGSNCWVFPAAHPTNGAAVLFSAHTAAIGSNSGFNANRLGYGGGVAGSIYPYGPGTGTVYSGSGHGGQGGAGSDAGGIAGKTYGNSNAPLAPGSGNRWGSGTTYGAEITSGGGSVQLRVAGSLTLLGVMTADGAIGGVNYRGGSSGGSIYLTCRTFIGSSTALVQANGGNGHYYGTPPVATGGGGGGGGRIAVWRVSDTSTGPVSNSAAGGLGYNATNAASGTIVWGWLPAAGTIFRFR